MTLRGLLSECQGKFAFSTAEEIAEGHSLQGRVAIVTGANSGLGKETARILAKIGAHVILACRSQQKCLEAKAEIDASTARASGAGATETMDLDLNSLRSVENFVEAFGAKGLPLHVLVNNAGLMMPALEPWRSDITEDGVETHFGVNYLGHFHLTTLLLERLKASPGSRVLNLASVAHMAAWPTDFPAELPVPRPLTAMHAYGLSKASMAMFSLELRRRLNGTGVLTAAGSPGVIETGLPRRDWKYQLLYRCVFPLLEVLFGVHIMKTIPQGAATTLCMALHDLPDGADPDEDMADGLFFADCLDLRQQDPRRLYAANVLNRTRAAELWVASERLVSRLTAQRAQGLA